MAKNTRTLVVYIFVILFFSSCAAKGRPSAESPDSAKADIGVKDKQYPGQHPDFENIGEREIGDEGINFYSIEKEIALGQQFAKEIEKYAKIVKDPVISEYVNRVGQNLARSSDARVPFTIRVIDDSAVNAFALPGGFFFVNTGLIMAVEEESELAGVMAHEIAHVAARHGTRQATRGQIINLATLPTIFLGGWIGYGIRQGLGIAVPVAFLKFSRKFEEEADELGLQYLWESGYDPNAMPSVFEKLAAKEKRKKGTLAKVFSSHPPNQKRVKRTQAIIEFLPSRDFYVLSTSEFSQVKERLIMLNEEWRRKDKEYEEGRPTLRRKDGGVIEHEDRDKGGKEEEEEDEPPVLKRKEKK